VSWRDKITNKSIRDRRIWRASSGREGLFFLSYFRINTIVLRINWCCESKCFKSINQVHVAVEFVAGVLICSLRLRPALLRVCTFEVANLTLQYVALFFIICQFLFQFPVDLCDFEDIFLTTNQLTHTPNVPHCSIGLRAAASWLSYYRTISINFFYKVD